MLRYPSSSAVCLGFAVALGLAADADPAKPAPAQPPAQTAAPKAPAPAAPAQAAPAPPASIAAPKPLTRNIGGPGDYGLRERFIKRLAGDDDVKNLKVSVAMVNGGVVLSGTMPNWRARRRALVLAGLERGVVNVTDEMTIERGAIGDGELLRAVSAQVQQQKDALGLKDLDISVSEGVATLSGTVKDFAARVRAEEIAGSVLGVTRLVNRLKPANAPSGSADAALKRAVAEYLKNNREFQYPADLKVEVKERKVRLEGQVNLYLARQQAATMAALVGGVTDVENRIVVDPSFQSMETVVTEVP